MRENEREILEYLRYCWQNVPYLRRYPFEEWKLAYYKDKLIFFNWKNKKFFRLNKDFKTYPLGTFFNEKLFVPGYPHIPRIYVLKTGLKRYLKYPFYAEEKIEGYNVRLVKIDNEILAFTRRGYICPFATDRWEDFLPELPEFFETQKNLIICSEVAGPGNPFVSEYPPYIKEDINFFVFDFMKEGTGEFLSVSEKIKLLEKYKLNCPEINGPFDPERDYKKIKDLLKKYHLEKREGVVFKPDYSGSRVKYVTPFSNLTDLKVVFPYLGEIDPHFVSLRLIRLALNLYEFEEFKEEVYKLLGENMFEDALKFFHTEKPFQETFKIKFKRESNFLSMLAHFRIAKINIEIKKTEWENGYLKVEFTKIYPRATQFWKTKLEGWGEVD